MTPSLQTPRAGHPARSASPERISNSSNRTSILPDRGRLVEAALALVEIGQRGQLPDLDDEIRAVRRRHKQESLDTTIGDKLYVEQIATLLTNTTGLPRQWCLDAAHEAIIPSWSAAAIDAIFAFATENSMEAFK
jgi:hypothetical protein